MCFCRDTPKSVSTVAPILFGTAIPGNRLTLIFAFSMAKCGGIGGEIEMQVEVFHKSLLFNSVTDAWKFVVPLALY